jgi:acylphosphatase
MANWTCTIRARGRVQGVYYRARTAEQAEALGVGGTVRNRDDGSVEVVAVGEREALERLVEWCRRGPPAARVESVEAEWGAGGAAMRGFRVTG